MDHPGKEKPKRRRYRLNKKKFSITLLTLGCIVAIIIVASESLANATGVGALVMDAGVPDTAETMTNDAENTQQVHSLEERLIVLDAGHGGFDPGAIGIDGTREDELNLSVTKFLKTELESCGAEVIMTRTDGDAIADTKEKDMAERRRIIEQSGSDIVLSIHMNSFQENPDVSGPVVLFMPGSELGETLAQAVQQTLNDTLHASGIARSKCLYVLESGNQPCILVECGYISNREEEQKLNQETYQKKVAKAICDGVRDFFQQKKTNVQES